MKVLEKKETIGFIAIVITFIGSEIVLDFWLGVQSLITKCCFVFLVLTIYYVIIKQFFTEKKFKKEESKIN